MSADNDTNPSPWTSLLDALTENPGRYPKKQIQDAFDGIDVFSSEFIPVLDSVQDPSKASAPLATAVLAGIVVCAHARRNDVSENLVSFLRREPDGEDSVLGDATTEILSTVLERIVDDAAAELGPLLSDPHACQWVRSAALLVVSARHRSGRIDAETARRVLAATPVSDKDEHLADRVGCFANFLGMDDLAADCADKVRAAYAGQHGKYSGTFLHDMYSPERAENEIRSWSEILDNSELMEREFHLDDHLELHEMEGWNWDKPPVPTNVLANVPVRAAPARSAKTGRNDPCPCGSGAKYKKCCLDRKTGE